MAEERFSDMETNWTRIRAAHLPGPEGQRAMSELISRYHDAVKRYLHLKVRDPHLAADILQDFWTKVLNHKLANADHDKGRFRDYLRTILHRLVIDHYRERKLQPLPAEDLLDDSRPDPDLDSVWRQTVLKGALKRLETFQAMTPRNQYATVLNLRLANPRTPIETLAATLAAQTGRPITPEAFRKTLQRARAKYVQLLIEEIRQTIHPSTDEDVYAEMYDLGLGRLLKRLQTGIE